LKILLVNNTIDPVTGGGSANRTIQVAEALINCYGVECTVLSTDCGFDGDIKNLNDKIRIVQLPCINDRYYIPLFNWKRLKDLLSKVDAIHLMSHWSILNAIIYVFARLYKKPYTFCPAGTLHIYGRSSLLKKCYNFVIGKRIIKNAYRCIAITELEKQDFLKYDIPEEKLIIIPNGIDSEIFYPNYDASFKFQQRFNLINIPYVLYMGRLNMIKGVDILLNAYKDFFVNFPDLHLVLAGPDEGLGGSLIKEIKKYSLEKTVHLVGYIEGDDKVGAYTGAKLLVVPSRREAMSIVALEAGACGTPVILTTECGFDEVKEVGCKVVQPLPNELSSGIQNMLSAPNDLKKVGNNLRELILRQYTWKKTAEKYFIISGLTTEVSECY